MAAPIPLTGGRQGQSECRLVHGAARNDHDNLKRAITAGPAHAAVA